VLVLLTEHTTGDLSSSGSAPALSPRSGISQFAFPRCRQIQALLSALVASAVRVFPSANLRVVISTVRFIS
jgi:hypothetical protein